MTIRFQRGSGSLEPVPGEGNEMGKAKKLTLNSDKMKLLLMGSNLALRSDVKPMLDQAAISLKAYSMFTDQGSS